MVAFVLDRTCKAVALGAKVALVELDVTMAFFGHTDIRRVGRDILRGDDRTLPQGLPRRQ